MNFDDGRVDHGKLHIRIIRYGIENPLENAGLHPIPVALEHRIPVAERRRQISPWAARARDPKHSFEKQPVVTPCAAGVRGLAQTKRLHLRPLSIRQNESVHSKLLSELESRAFQSVNPESQQTLEHDLKFVGVFFAHLIRARARLFIGSGRFVFYLCAANGDVIF